MYKEDECVICSCKFDYPDRFPKDFPDEWKLCCLCRSYAYCIVEYGGVEIYITGWISVMGKNRSHAFPKQMRKINRLISLN